MTIVNHLSSISHGDAAPNYTKDGARVVLLVTADSTLSHRLIRILSGNGERSQQGEPQSYQVAVATSVAQARSHISRAVPAVILLDESIGAPNLFTHVVQDLTHIAPIIFLAAPENLARWCAQAESSELVAQCHVECVPRQGDFLPLAACLIERHACRRPENEGRNGHHSVLSSVANRMEVNPEDVPPDFGEMLRHEVNNPLTGILGNAELLLSRRDRLSADMVERLEIIADLAIRLRETVRRLSNALDPRTSRILAHSPGELPSSRRHLPST